MAKRPGSKSSRSERRAGRQRAIRAREHGLPERRDPESRRVRAATPEPQSFTGDDRSSDAPLPPRAKRGAGIPPLVKIVGVALVLLAAAYVLTRLRDQSPSPATASPEPAAAALTSAAPLEEPPPSAPPPAAAPPVAELPAAEVVAPGKPTAATPVAATSSKPGAKLAPVVAPKPIAAPPKPAAPGEPADNPY